MQIKKNRVLSGCVYPMDSGFPSFLGPYSNDVFFFSEKSNFYPSVV